MRSIGKVADIISRQKSLLKSIGKPELTRKFSDSSHDIDEKTMKLLLEVPSLIGENMYYKANDNLRKLSTIYFENNKVLRYIIQDKPA